ncbi:MAG: acyltransferase family protein [Lysobacter sp.]
MRGKLAYSPALDGLRAIAVLAVVAYHAGAPVYAGFVGVDIFFVISGYLITRLLHNELQVTGRISFLDFYARRARRILPALVAVIVITLAASIVLLLRNGVAETGKAAAAAFVFAANVFFANAPAGYFDAAPQDNPLLHLWSLGVEEQFYLVWPVVLVLARKQPVPILAAIAASSFLTCEWMLWTGHEQAAFYQAPPRAWELAVGGLIALGRIQLPRWAAPAGLALVLASCMATSRHFPGAGALPAVLGASLLVAAIHGGHRCAPLESRPIVWIGLISYSLYLWHWPIIVLGQALPAAAQIAMAFALAALSYYFVERPFRKRWVVSPRRSVATAALVVAAGAASAITLQPLNLGIQPIPAANVPDIYKMGCDDYFTSAELKPCKFGRDDAPNKAVVVGDSVSLQWFPALYRMFDRPGWQLIAITKSACPMMDISFYDKRLHRVYTECEEWRADALSMIDGLHPNVVIVGNANHYDFGREQWTSGAHAIFSRLSGSADAVRVIRSTPLLIPGGQNDFTSVATWELEAAAGLPNVGVVDMNNDVCPSVECERSTTAGPIFRDNRHIDWNYAATLAKPLQAKLAIPGLGAKRSGMVQKEE